jgi:hypothetical protein
MNYILVLSSRFYFILLQSTNLLRTPYIFAFPARREFRLSQERLDLELIAVRNGVLHADGDTGFACYCIPGRMNTSSRLLLNPPSCNIPSLCRAFARVNDPFRNFGSAPTIQSFNSLGPSAIERQFNHARLLEPQTGHDQPHGGSYAAPRIFP